MPNARLALWPLSRAGLMQAPSPGRASRGRRWRGPWALVGLWALATWAVGGGSSPKAGEQDIERALAQVQTLIGTPRCREDRECRSIGIGSRPCGGPSHYVAWSTLVSDPVALQKAVVRHAELRRIADEQSGRMSDCRLIEEPAVRCQRAEGQAFGRCEVVPPASGPRGNATVR